MLSRIYLIRHGVTKGNLRHWYYGATDIPLTDDGYDRIKSYAGQGIYPEIPADADIYTTGLIRTEQTPEAMYGGVPHDSIPDLQEINFGKAECMTYDELKKFDNFDAWAWDTTGDVRIADAETANEFHERIYRGLDELLKRHGEKEKAQKGSGRDAVTVMVCHGGVISCIMEKLFPAVCGSMWDWLPEPGFGYAVDFENGAPYMYSKINDIGRLGLGIYRLPSSGDQSRRAADSDAGEALAEMTKPYLAGGHGYFEIYYNAANYLRTGDQSGDAAGVPERSDAQAGPATDPALLSKAVKDGLVSRNPRDSYKLSASIDLADYGKVEEYLNAAGADRFDRVAVWDVERNYVGDDPETGKIHTAFASLSKLKKRGLIGKIGLGFFGDPGVFDRLLKEQAAIDFVELAVNYQNGYGNGERSQKYYTIARRRYKEILVTSPFDGGRLARELPAAEEPPHAFTEMKAKKTKGADQPGDSMAGYAMMKKAQAPKSPVEWALRYVLSLPFVTVCVASSGVPAHTKENLAAAEDYRPLSEAQQETLRKSALARRTPEYTELTALMEQAGDPENAAWMKKYMRDQFEFYGVKTPARRKIYKDFLKAEKKRGTVNWAFLDDCYADPHREMQYLAYDYLLKMQDALCYDDIEHIRRFVQTKPWWDTVDFLCRAIGKIGEKDSRVDDLMLEWAGDADLWIRRTAIEHQLCRKEKMDTKLLAAIIEKNLGSTEFFINKAIGWALRDYSKTDPAWVRDFIASHRDSLSRLSIREGSKYI